MTDQSQLLCEPDSGGRACRHCGTPLAGAIRWGRDGAVARLCDKPRTDGGEATPPPQTIPGKAAQVEALAHAGALPRGYAGDQSGIPPVEHVHGAVFIKVATVLTRAQEQLADIGGLHDCELKVTVPRALWQQLCEHDCIRRAVDGPAGAIIIEPDDLGDAGGT